MKAYRFEILGLLSALGLMSLLAFASSAHAEPGAQDRMGGRGHGAPGDGAITERMAERLGLDETQWQNVQNVLEAAKPEFEALRQAARDNHQARAKLDPASASYAADLDRIATEKGRLATEKTLLSVRVRTEVNAFLTEEQQVKLERSKRHAPKAR